jgi:ribulose-5-phosphate 4-epimerase/fuculose-1-phosphate aldolase
MAVGETMRKAANRAIMLEETARLFLYCKQFGGELTVIPPDWVERLLPIKDFI